MFSHKVLVRLVLVVVALAVVTGCAAPSTASKAISRGVIESGGIVPEEQLRVAEYLAYYEQSFPEPTETALGLDLRLGNPQVASAGGEAWLQLGLQAKSAKPEEIAPLNLAIVVDESGSMGAANKMSYVKDSLRVFLQSLAMNDRVALIGYSNDAWVIEPSREVGDGQWISAAIDRLEPRQSTNLHAGLMLGMREVERRFDSSRNNRVILLTDGIANQGVTDPDQIAADAKAYNDRGVYLSTIGLGRDLNDALLSQLAIQGQGAYHFIDSAEEIEKVFRRDVLGLVEKVAGDVSVIVRPEPGVQLLSVTGYDGVPPAGPVEVKLRDMGTGDSQVILVRLMLAAAEPGARRLGDVTLNYTDLKAEKPESLTLPVQAESVQQGSYDPLWDVEVLRNVTIQRTAEGLKEISRLYQERRYQDAWDIAHRLELDLRHVASLKDEAQMVKDADLMRTYQETLANLVRQQTGHGPEEAADEPQPQGTRIFRGPTSEIPTLEVK